MNPVTQFFSMKPANIVVSSSSERIAWIDVARGLCMILVVAMHFDEMHYGALFDNNNITKLWDWLTSAAKPARLPTFFMISGFLASAAVQRKWADILDNRVKLLYYLYVIWMIMHLVILYLVYTPADSSVAAEFFTRLAIELFWPQTQLWFIFALIVFFLVARVFRNQPAIAIVFAIILSVFAEQIPNLVASQMSRSFLFFLLGAYFPSILNMVASRANVKTLVISGGAYVITVMVILLFGENVVGIWLPASMVGVVLLSIISVFLVKSKLSDPIALVGRQTLPIYVMHGPLIMMLHQYISSLTSSSSTSDWHPILVALYPIVGNILILVLCLTVYRILVFCRFGWLFKLPSWALSRQKRVIVPQP